MILSSKKFVDFASKTSELKSPLSPVTFRDIELCAGELINTYYLHDVFLCDHFQCSCCIRFRKFTNSASVLLYLTVPVTYLQ